MDTDLEAYPYPADPEAEDLLSWDDSIAIAQALSAQHENTNLEDVSLGMIYRWTLELQFFKDDPELANEEILLAIYQEWFEEANPIKCNNPKNKMPDRVHGGYIAFTPDWLRGRIELEACGPDGRWWEPK